MNTNKKIIEKKQGKQTRQDLIAAFDKSKTKSISEICRIVGISRRTFYFHYEKNPVFRRNFIQKQKESLEMALQEV